MEYPVTLEPDSNGTVLATFPDLDGVHTFGDNEQDALTHAADALVTGVEYLIRSRRPVPVPSRGAGLRVALPALLAAKVALHNEMLRQKVNKAELGRRLKQHQPQIDRLIDVHHSSHLGQMEAAMGALGKRFEIRVVDAGPVLMTTARRMMSRSPGRRRAAKKVHRTAAKR